MGRSVSYPAGSLVCFTLLDDEGDGEWAYEWLCDDLVARAREAFPSFDTCKGWRGREDRILLRSAYADFGISTYGGLAAVWIAERDDGSYWDHDRRTGCHARAGHWLRRIAPRFDAAFGDYDCLGHMSNGEGVYRRRIELENGWGLRRHAAIDESGEGSSGACHPRRSIMSYPCPPSAPRAGAIANLNDQVRLGRDPRARTVLTRGVADLVAGEGDERTRHARTIVNQVRLLAQLAAAPIGPGDDPYGERDFGAFTFMDQRLFWKVDAYADDGTFSWGSAAPWDAAVTIRVLTIMLAEEY